MPGSYVQDSLAADTVFFDVIVGTGTDISFATAETSGWLTHRFTYVVTAGSGVDMDIILQGADDSGFTTNVTDLYRIEGLDENDSYTGALPHLATIYNQQPYIRGVSETNAGTGIVITLASTLVPGTHYMREPLGANVGDVTLG